jgi:hypothetical protein
MNKEKSLSKASSTLLSKNDELWTVEDLARFAKLSLSKIYRDAEGGLIPCHRWGKRGLGKKPVLRFYPGEIMAWLNADCPVASEGADMGYGAPK